MDWLSIADDFFDNSSVSAFLGAAAAFLLVYLTDLRRKSKKRKTLREAVAGALALATKKSGSVTTSRNLLRERDELQPGEVQSFPSTMIEALLLDLYDEIPQDERGSMEALLFRMRAIDSLLDGIRLNAERLYRLYIEKDVGTESQALKRYILIDYEAVLSNLKHLGDLGDFFLKRDYQGMSDWRFSTTRSESIPT